MKSIQCSKCKATLKVDLLRVLKGRDAVSVKCGGCENTITLRKTVKQASKTSGPRTVVPTHIKSKVDKTLYIEDITNNPQKFELDQPFLSFGRSSESVPTDIQYATIDTKISRKHCVFKKEPLGTTIKDTSLNGVYLNGEKLKEGEVLYIKEGDQIKMGNTCFKVGAKQ